ncbi:MAG: LLM class flavin-dependent oxidoreductase, partial [Alphaproteobacteria bacterium]|nr:LLM class flavin-dependent oxidoreductase [Alphaproteobacteria bacterium]
MADIGIGSESQHPVATIVEQVRAAEAGGASTFWLASHLFLRDPITTAALALQATSRIRVALMAISPYAMHPVHAAMAAGTLDEMFPGRVILCLGVGAPGDRAAAGIDKPKPVATLGEAIAVCRALLAGETVRHDGQIFAVSGRRLVNGTGRVPVMLAASGPQMLALAGRLADGVVISATTSVPFVRWCLEHVDRGAAERAAGRTRRHALVMTSVAAKPADAHAKVRRKLGFVLRGAHHARNLELAGTRLDQAALYAAYAAEDWPTVERLVNDGVVRNHAASGTPTEVRAAIQRYQAIGLDEVILIGADTPAEVAETLAAARA